MAEASDTKGALYQNLADAGCGEEMTGQFMALAERGKAAEALLLLKRHRRELLDCCHAEQKKLDCLDYLIFQLQKEHKTGGK